MVRSGRPPQALRQTRLPLSWYRDRHGRWHGYVAWLVREREDRHHYLTRRLAIEAITNIETAPVLRTLKAAALSDQEQHRHVTAEPAISRPSSAHASAGTENQEGPTPRSRQTLFT